MLRSYPAERCMDYGCALEDVLKLRRRVEAGHGWDAIALQLTNVLRDVGEDAAAGRVYLPREDLLRFGYDESRLRRGVRDARRALTPASCRGRHASELRGHGRPQRASKACSVTSLTHTRLGAEPGAALARNATPTDGSS